jgi:TraB/PrgY/gumN family
VGSSVARQEVRSTIAIIRRLACTPHNGEHRGSTPCDAHQALTMKILLAACALTASSLARAAAAPAMTQPSVSDAQLAEVLVVGKQPGPGLWRISKGDHDLWIFATLTPLPKQMIWDATDIEKHIGQSQAVLAPPRIDPHVGFFRGLTLLPSLLRARHNPDGRTLEQVVPHDLYMRWLGLRVKYLGNSGDEKLRPMLAAFDLADHALDEEGLNDDPDIWKRIESISRRARVPIEPVVLDLKIHDEKAYVRDLTQISTERELACLRSVIEHLERDLPSLRERANLWSLGDVARLRPLLPADEPIACFDAVMSVSRFRSEYDQVSARLDALWISSAEQALQRNRSTLAVVGIKKLLAADGWLAQLRSRGYEIREP